MKKNIKAPAERIFANSKRMRTSSGKEENPVTLAQSITDRLRALIVEGRFAPKEKLHEVSLSELLGASRTPVRAALSSLAAEGLLAYAPNKGYSIGHVDADKLISIFDVRGVLEGLAARLAAQRGLGESELATFRESLKQGDEIFMRGYLRPEDREIFGGINSTIHDVIMQAAGNGMVVDMIRHCHNIPISSDKNVLWSDFNWLRRSHDDHHRMLEAILLRDGARAEWLMREHVHTVKLQMKAHIEEHSFISADQIAGT